MSVAGSQDQDPSTMSRSLPDGGKGPPVSGCNTKPARRPAIERRSRDRPRAGARQARPATTIGAGPRATVKRSGGAPRQGVVGRRHTSRRSLRSLEVCRGGTGCTPTPRQPNATQGARQAGSRQTRPRESPASIGRALRGDPGVRRDDGGENSPGRLQGRSGDPGVRRGWRGEDSPGRLQGRSGDPGARRDDRSRVSTSGTPSALAQAPHRHLGQERCAVGEHVVVEQGPW